MMNDVHTDEAERLLDAWAEQETNEEADGIGFDYLLASIARSLLSIATSLNSLTTEYENENRETSHAFKTFPVI